MSEYPNTFRVLAYKFRWVIIVLLILSTVFILAIVDSKKFAKKYEGQFYPGVLVGGESVGGKTYNEVLDSFTEKVKYLEENGLSVSFTNSNRVQKVKIPMSAGGNTPDNSVEYFSLNNWQTSLEEAYQWGRSNNHVVNFKERVMLKFRPKEFTFTNRVYKESIHSFLDADVYGFFKKSVPATFSFIHDKVTILGEKEGETIDRDQVLDILENKILLLDTTHTDFAINQDIPKVTVAQLEPFIGFAESFAKDKNLVFKYKEYEWKVTGKKLITWLTIDDKNSLSIDNVKLENYLDNTIVGFVDNPPKNSRFQMKDGGLVEIAAGEPGNIIDTEDLLKKINKAVFDSTEEPEKNTIYIDIQTIQVEPKVTKKTIETYGILDLVGEIRTGFKGSTKDREHNIKVGVATINGMLIPPGAEFSTVASIGPVTEKEGYLKEMVIKEDKTTKEYGGGLCQVATTLFRLALNAGLPITERQNHRFVIHYYDPPGLDATIYGPHPDFRFRNDTNNYLLLQARVENQQVIMELYGKKDGRSVEISKPLVYDKIPAPPTKYVPTTELPMGQTKCTETPHDGVTTDVLYTVTYPNGVIKEKNFHSVYKPWQKVCLVGTAL